MKEGRTLTELAAEIERQAGSKLDMIASTSKIEILHAVTDTEVKSAHLVPYALSVPVTRAVEMKGRKQRGPESVTETELFALNRFAIGQIASHTKIPMQLIDLLSAGTEREKVELGNLLTVRLQENPTSRMIRTLSSLEGVPHVRAFLSDRYRRLDNYDLAEAVLPVLSSLKGLEVNSCEITDERMYIKASWPKMQYKVGRARDAGGDMVDDIVQAGLVVSNSEVGSGALRVEPFLMRLVCVNGMIAADSGVKRYHVGRQHQGTFEGEVGSAYELYTDETLALDDAAFFGKVVDTTRAVLTDEGKFQKVVERMIEAAGERLDKKADIETAVTVLAQKVKLNEGERGLVLRHFIEGGDLSRWGMVNAVTRASADVDDYDRATQLEKVGGQVLTLAAPEWKQIATAVKAKAA
jgi:hypothetical protein